MIAKFLIPINTIRRIIIAVPPKAEYEAGFQKWVEHFSPDGRYVGLPGTFLCKRGNNCTVAGIGEEKTYGQTLTDFSRLDDWGEFADIDRASELRPFACSDKRT